MLNFDFKKYNRKYVDEIEVEKYNSKNAEIKERFYAGDLQQWMDVKTYISDDELISIKNMAKNIRKCAQVLVVIGIGGSYMGSKAIIEALSPLYRKNDTEIIFLGKNINPREYVETLEYIQDKDIAVNVISKSGTTLEPSIAFDLVLELMQKKYSENELKERIIITTDKESGTLRQMVNEKGYQSLVVPTTVGGRYSVFTPVGLLPIAVAGIDIDKLLLGVERGIKYSLNDAFEYATIRDIMYHKGKMVESFTIYDEKMNYVAEWLKQLFAESHGKDKKGLLPISNINTRDLHSMGQFLQEGKDIIFETVIGIKNNPSIYLNNYKWDLNAMNNMALEKVCEAHSNGYTPSSIIWMEQLDEENIGQLMQFFMYAAIIGGLQLGINPFDQPGVQEYKRLVTEGLKQ